MRQAETPGQLETVELGNNGGLKNQNVSHFCAYEGALRNLMLVSGMQDLKDPKLGELWYIPYYGECRIFTLNRES